MSGGKETPRQKMIGMMYLVLTALLALNVSKSILDAFVAIEENTQKANIVQYDRGTGFIMDVSSEKSSTKDDAENKAKLEKLTYVLNQMDLIDQEAAKMIQEIDKLKLKIIDESGESIVVEDKNEASIIWTKTDLEMGALPIRMNLMAVQAKDAYNDAMRIMIGQDIKRPEGDGMKLWENFNKYRNRIVELTGSYEWGGKTFSVKPKNIPEFEDNKDLAKQVAKMIDASKGNLKEDRQVLIDLYIGMTKREKSEDRGTSDVHWIGKTFNGSPLVAAIASLSSMEQDVLAARALALAHWKSKVSTGEYSFNKIMPLAYGPLIANGGDSIELQVMMAAFDSENQPKVTIEEMEGAEIVYPGNGQGIIRLKAGGSAMSLKGTVSIKNKSGVPKTADWSHEIVIMKPQGSIELPEMNMLYRGYANKVEATASGYDQTRLTASGASLTKSGTGWIAKPTGRSREAYLTVSGTNSATGKSVTLKKVKYRVSNLPDPELYWGGAKSGTKANKRSTKLFAKYPPEIPLNATFKVVSWECTIPGAPGRPPTGSGSNISSASSLILQARPGMTVSFIATVIGPDGIRRKKAGAFKI
ncbi:MAG: hypothetical protein COA33_003170 [Fluviicola sp.]|nr:hypothetical protein [Fluviicola sp.]